jgi:hypothetical protein
MDFFNTGEHFVSYFSHISQFGNPGARLVSRGRKPGLGLLKIRAEAIEIQRA